MGRETRCSDKDRVIEMAEPSSKIKRLHDITRLVLSTLERSGYPVEECAVAIHILHALFVSHLSDRGRKEIAELIEYVAHEFERLRLREKHRVIGG